MNTNKSLTSRSTTTNKRLNKDYQTLVTSSQVFAESSKNKNIKKSTNTHYVVHDVINTKKDDNSEFLVVINGASGTSYENAKVIFKVSIDKTKRNYPFVAPVVTCVTPIYHPNIDKHGHICLDILGKNWVAAQTFESIATSLSSFLDEPNPDDPLFTEAATMCKQNRKEYNVRVKTFVDKYATNAEYLRIKNGGKLEFVHNYIGSADSHNVIYGDSDEDSEVD